MTISDALSVDRILAAARQEIQSTKPKAYATNLAISELPELKNVAPDLAQKLTEFAEAVKLAGYKTLGFQQTNFLQAGQTTYLDFAMGQQNDPEGRKLLVNFVRLKKGGGNPPENYYYSRPVNLKTSFDYPSGDGSFKDISVVLDSVARYLVEEKYFDAPRPADAAIERAARVFEDHGL